MTCTRMSRPKEIVLQDLEECQHSACQLDDLLADIPEPTLSFRLLDEESDTECSTTVDSDIIEYPPNYPVGCEECGVRTLVSYSPKDIPLEAADSMPYPRVKTYVGKDTVIDTMHHHTEGLVYETTKSTVDTNVRNFYFADAVN